MKIGDLVRNAYGSMGVITKRHESLRFRVWVQWTAGDHSPEHVANLEVINESR
ncbi:MAG: hypothetical protein VYC12_01895 [Candidatus Thermoplasmatota archaeon]|nr:hypothetical protein [Candidatus Thermoplasmatota archaeon]